MSTYKVLIVSITHCVDKMIRKRMRHVAVNGYNLLILSGDVQCVLHGKNLYTQLLPHTRRLHKAHAHTTHPVDRSSQRLRNLNRAIICATEYVHCLTFSEL